VNNGQIEHINATHNTLAYPSGDDHPSVEGSRKASGEFLPMLNVFYHRWKENAPIQPAPESEPTTQAESQPEPPATTSGSIDNFDAGPIPGAYGWEAYYDEATTSSMACGAESGTSRNGNALQLDFNIAANSWGTCALMYETPQNWSTGNGLVFYYRTSQAGTIFDIDLYAGPSENRETYLYTIETSTESATDWALMEVRWEDFHRASWEEDAGATFTKADQIIGVAFGLGTPPDSPNISTVWVDDLALLGMPPTATENTPQESSAPTAAPEQLTPIEQPQKPSLPCAGALVMPLSVLAGLSLWKRQHR
jgi:hypothetical protein